VIKKENKLLTRKEFLKTSVWMLTCSFIGSKTFDKPTYESPKIILGRTGIKVPAICYGASRTQEIALIKTVLDKEINFFDTGRSYANGQNEIMLGKALKGLRKQVVIQSKIKLRIREKGEELKSSDVINKIKKQMEYSLHASLKALQTDYIDIMLFHSATSNRLLFHEAVLEFFNQAKMSGKIRACGFSVHTNQLDIIEMASDNQVFDVVMMPYNHKGSYNHSTSGQYSKWDQSKLEILLKILHKKKIGIIAMKTCSAGPFAIHDSENPSYRDAIKWVLNQDFIDCAAVAMANFEQIKEDLSALN
jgi:aryl-alcohol dehydrogenase-like predicted oxidoreductase